METKIYTIGPAKIGTTSAAVTSIKTGRVIRLFKRDSAHNNLRTALNYVKSNHPKAQVFMSVSEPEKASAWDLEHLDIAFDKPTAKQLTRLADKLHAISEVKQMVKPGQRVSVCLISVARSGMSRRVKLLVSHKGQTRDITRLTAIILNWHYDGDSVRVDGCGTDAAFEVVYNLSRQVFASGFKVPEGMYRGNTDANGWSLDGGYALRNQWV